MLVWLQHPAQTQHSQHAQVLFESGLTLYTSGAKPAILAALTINPTFSVAAQDFDQASASLQERSHAAPLL